MRPPPLAQLPCQVELSARSEEALDALQTRARSRLPGLAHVIGYPSGSLWAGACLVSFDAPEGEAAEAAEGAAEGPAEGAGAAQQQLQQQQQHQVAGGEQQQAQQQAADDAAAAAAGPSGAAGEAEEAEGPAPHRCLFFVGASAKEVGRDQSAAILRCAVAP